MAYISFQPSDFFSPKIYTGTGAEQAITGVGFQPDTTWIKDRESSEDHHLIDSVRGATDFIIPNTTGGENTNAQDLKSFDSDGFTVGTAVEVNKNTSDFISWNWKAGTTSGLSGGTITPTGYSINTTSGFGIYEYTGTNTNATIAHGLGVAPKLVIVKRLTSGASWLVQHDGLTSAAYVLKLDTNGAESSDSANFNGTAPTSTVFSLGTSNNTNKTGIVHMAYVFAEIKGYSKFGSYIGNGDNNGAVVYTGFRPAFVILKESIGGNAGGWITYDNKRPTSYNVNQDYLQANDLAAEVNASTYAIDFNSNGFKIRASNGVINGGGNAYVYLAFAEFPLVSSNSKAGTAR